MRENPAMQYKVSTLLDTGGQAEVYKAKRFSDDKEFALKMMQPTS